MASVDDVAAAIIKRTGPISTMKLQKLVYYSQAWHLVWDERPLFEDEPIEAWVGGPVVRSLYERHRGSFSVSEWPWGEASRRTESESETVDAVVDAYGRLSGQRLSALTHREGPWRAARAGLGPGERGSRVIDLMDMADYYAGVADDPDAEDVGLVNDDVPAG